MHYLYTEPESEPFLLEELGRAGIRVGERPTAGLVGVEFSLDPEPPIVVFARQCLPDATLCVRGSISAWAALLFETVCGRLPDGKPWHLHIAPFYGASSAAGQQRCRLIREALMDLLRRKRRSMARGLVAGPVPFTSDHSMVQLALSAPDSGWLSVAAAPTPWKGRRLLSPFVKGDVPVAEDKTAPSRAFAKLVEAEQRMGRRIQAEERCVDLGASPGSWSYVALNREARVFAVDRAALREDLMRHPRLEFQKGDAFSYQPETPVDWLLCDVIAAPERSIGLVRDWVSRRLCRHFVVTIKFKGHGEYSKLDILKTSMPPMCSDFYLSRLSANKNETCAFGTVAG